MDKNKINNKKKYFCHKIGREVDTEECYDCFLKTSNYPRSGLCREINIHQPVEKVTF